MPSQPIYGRSDLEIWIDAAATAEQYSAQWTRDWRQFPGGALRDRNYVLACQKHSARWAEIAEFAFDEAAKMESDSSYSPDDDRMRNMVYRANK